MPGSRATEHQLDLVVIGAGIIGLATARAFVRAVPGAKVVVVDKEPSVAAHQSGHNSGVVHAGLYYRPDSHKARLCASGREELAEYCRDRGVPYDRCGKVVVARTRAEVPALQELERRGRANGLTLERLGPGGIADHEPHATGVAGLFVPATAVVDFAAACRAMAADLERDGVAIRLAVEVTGIDEDAGGVVVRTAGEAFGAARLVNCAGLQADRLAVAAGVRPAVRIVPFRGEYLALRPERSFLVRHLLYPVPDPRFPFLGLHLSRGVDGRVHAGPNAVLALAREGYGWGAVEPSHLAQLAHSAGARRLARRYWRTGVHEVWRSLRRQRFVDELRTLVPAIEPTDLSPGGSGVRAQAVAPDGTLVDDFALARTDRCVHVLNAPSPGATASLAIGRWLATQVGAPVPTLGG